MDGDLGDLPFKLLEETPFNGRNDAHDLFSGRE
jgi:hypothetical protein